MMHWKKWRHYLLGSTVIIKTDQQSLNFITNQKITEGVQHKLMMKLLEFNFTIQYKKCSTTRVADALPRVLPKCMSMSSVTPVWAEELLLSFKNDLVTQK